MPIMVKICSCYDLMWVVDQKPDNHLEWPNYAYGNTCIILLSIYHYTISYLWLVIQEASTIYCTFTNNYNYLLLHTIFDK